MAIEIVDFPIENGGSFHSYVKLPEGSYKLVAPLMSYPNPLHSKKIQKEPWSSLLEGFPDSSLISPGDSYSKMPRLPGCSAISYQISGDVHQVQDPSPSIHVPGAEAVTWGGQNDTLRLTQKGRQWKVTIELVTCLEDELPITNINTEGFVKHCKTKWYQAYHHCHHYRDYHHSHHSYHSHHSHHSHHHHHHH